MAEKQMILSISLRCVFIVEESMAYYLKMIVLSFVWKWKLGIMTYLCYFMEEL